MEIKAFKENGVIEVSLSGRLDMDGAYKAEQHFTKYAESGNTFVLDFEKVEFLSSAGIRALLSLYRLVSETNGSVTIKKPQPAVLGVLEETDFVELFKIIKA